MSSSTAGSARTPGGSESPLSGESCKRTMAPGRSPLLTRAATCSERVPERPSKPRALQATIVRSRSTGDPGDDGVGVSDGRAEETRTPTRQPLERDHRLLEVVADAALSSQREQTIVGIRVDLDGVASLEDLADHFGVLLGLARHDEEGGSARPARREDVEDRARPPGVRSVVEGQGDATGLPRAADDGVGEDPQRQHEHADEHEGRVTEQRGGGVAEGRRPDQHRVEGHAQQGAGGAMQGEPYRRHLSPGAA